jgi:hypothetical protein
MIATAVVSLLVHLVGPATTLNAHGCFLRLSTRIEPAGRAVYCIRDFRGAPGANAVVHDSGLLTLHLPARTVRAQVQVVERFAADGRHARQKLHGTVDGGGTIAGGGTLVESPPGHVSASSLRYRLDLG